MDRIIIPILTLGGLGILFALILSFASKKFHVKVDRRIEAVRAELPGANCGACGFPGCDGLAAAIINDGAAITACPVGGESLVHRLAELLGRVADETSKEVACVMCQGDCNLAEEKFHYIGINDCRANQNIQGGSKKCSYGCLGCGTCKDVCNFGAIEMVNRLPVIDKDKCTACRQCVEICPRNIIKMVDYEQPVMVKCVSFDKGKDVRGSCKVGCIGCRICAKQCPDGFVIENNLAHFNWSKDLDMEEVYNAVDKCPTKAIYPGLERQEKKKEEKRKEKLAKNA
ncbi:MAG: RnfABCDGE type electron transport complex subunit B [Tissierellia bacterium]|nr:RnfABCDGE type electron transport complex subunit B [Tissierellia bacterium]